MYPYVVAGAILFLGVIGIARSRNLVHAVVCLAVAQSGTYVLLLTVGYQRGATAPIFQSAPEKAGYAATLVDPVVQALTLTDIVVSATVTSMLLALAVQIAKRHDTVDPDELRSLRG
ncbi:MULTISPECIES: sodium:proton antiporter [unclassified Arthrobacter]|uniref:sodium:proton antiporter n=1 Tax=unclassified Arthrobacter TaxID=235627 RepID=UPI00210B55A7|nr:MULTISPECIES: cation:proton antiporter subunit C [unclassified Arthrobacter]MCQ9165753.1 cation:proton antiporter subunit C [Arthrobacter sp. STN4]